MTLNDPRILHLFLGDILNHLSHLGSIPGLGRSPGGEHGNSLQYSSMEDPHGQRSLVGYSPWGHKELDMTEATEHPCMHATLTRSAGATTPSLTSYLLLWAECSFDV